MNRSTRIMGIALVMWLALSSLASSQQSSLSLKPNANDLYYPGILSGNPESQQPVVHLAPELPSLYEVFNVPEPATDLSTWGVDPAVFYQTLPYAEDPSGVIYHVDLGAPISFRPGPSYSEKVEEYRRADDWKNYRRNPTFNHWMLDNLRQSLPDGAEEAHADLQKGCKAWSLAIGGGSAWSVGKAVRKVPLSLRDLAIQGVGLGCKVVEHIPPSASRDLMYQPVFKFLDGELQVRDVLSGLGTMTMPRWQWPEFDNTPFDLRLWGTPSPTDRVDPFRLNSSFPSPPHEPISPFDRTLWDDSD